MIMIMNNNTKSNEVRYVGLTYLVSLDAIIGMMVLTGENDRYSMSVDVFTNKVINGSIQSEGGI